jgi:DNA-binding XRE family transcriptional regulator
MIRRVKTGKDLLAWRTRMAISARQLAKLIGVAERSIHRAEQTGNLGVKISLAMELLLTRLQHGEMEPGSGGTWGRVCRRVAWEDEHRRGYTPLATVSGAMAKGFSGASRCACDNAQSG